ncbi:hypothetical protein U1701_13120 [Sphingomonas sp. PB2P19]|uniref:hypothetical protein n=1 Tax=Sphingomonas rhamnosi TaxID=3096156 RepID=UPI002FC70EAC
MVDIAWPADLAPYRVMFYLQPHVGGSESPFSRTTKRYGLSAPRWVARLTFRGGYDGIPALHEPGGFGPRLDSLIADLDGGLNVAVFHDFRRPRPARPVTAAQALTFDAAATGATSVTVRGFAPYAIALSAGDYVGGDGRPHLTSLANTLSAGGTVNGAGAIMADATGAAVIGVRPHISAPIAAGAMLQWPVTGRFELTSEDAGQNETEVGALTEYTLDFVEKLL